jgi:hypothetical protein
VSVFFNTNMPVRACEIFTGRRVLKELERALRTKLELPRVILGEAVAASVDAFVTGDAKLAALGSVGRLRILTPRQLWELLRSDEQAGG